MKDLISGLHKAGFAYTADDGVYFSIAAYKASGKTYGQLLEINTGNTSAARIQNDEYDKASAHDFALWKTQKPGEPSWEFSLDGHDLTGRPGWHIECSVMSRSALGQPFDIHTGGVDLIFPHHENEIAQSTALETDPIMATFFCHNEHILVDGKKMAKSAQNFFTLEDITRRGYDPVAFRLLVLQAHYRNQVNFSFESLTAAHNRLKRLRNFAVQRYQLPTADPHRTWTYYAPWLEQAGVIAAIKNDLNTPEALSALDSFIDGIDKSNGKNDYSVESGLIELIDRIFGLGLLAERDILPEQYAVIKQREQVRADKDWVASDRLRDELAQQGIGLRDTPRGAIWYRI